MSTYRRRWCDFSIAIERIFCVIRCMEGKPSTRGGYLHLGILSTVERLYIKCWRRRCLLNHKGYGVTTYRLTLAYYLYIIIESTCISERRYIVRRILSYWSSSCIGSGSGLIPLIVECTTSFGYYTKWPNCFILAIGISCRKCRDSGLLVNGHPYRNGAFLITTIVLNHTIVIGNSCRGSVRGIGISRHPCGRTSMYNRRGIFEPLIGQSLSGSHYLEGLHPCLSLAIGSIGRLLDDGHRGFYHYRNDITYWDCTSCIVGYLHKVIGGSLLIRSWGIGCLSSSQYRGCSCGTIRAILIPLVGIVRIITRCHYSKRCCSSPFTIRGSWSYRLGLDF